MSKDRVVLDLEEGLKEDFRKRLELLDSRMKMTAVLRSVMYVLIDMTNDELRSFVNQGTIKAASQSEYLRIIDRAREQGLLPESFQAINPAIRECKRLLIDWEQNKINSEEVTAELERVISEGFWKTPEGRREMLRRYDAEKAGGNL